MNPDDLKNCLSLHSVPEPPTRLMMCTLVLPRLPIIMATQSSRQGGHRISWVLDIAYAHQDTANVDAQARSVHQPVPDLHGAMVHRRRRNGRQLQARGPGASTPSRLKLVLRTSRDVLIRLHLDLEELLQPGVQGHRRATSALGRHQNA